MKTPRFVVPLSKEKVQAAAAAQNQLEQTTPQIPFDAVSLPLMPDGHTIGDATDEVPQRAIWRHYRTLMEEGS